MKKIISAACIAAALLSGYSIYHTSNETNIDSVVLENIEALAQSPEQPELDCRYAKDLTCISLHPTNPKLDKEKKNATWNQ